MQKFASLFVVSAALVASAHAQSTTIDHPLRAELGLYIPTFSGSDNNVGVTVGAGYAFYKVSGIEFAGVVRGSFFSVDSSDISLATYGVDARYQPVGQKFFVGVGLGATDGHEHISGFGSGSTTKLGYSGEIGYDFTDKVYGVARYQGASINGFRGVTVGVGYRF